jgi:hypothetical protein
MRSRVNGVTKAWFLNEKRQFLVAGPKVSDR